MADRGLPQHDACPVLATAKMRSGRVPMATGLPLQTDIVTVRRDVSNVPVVPNAVRRLLAYPSVQATVDRYDRPRQVGRLI